MHEQTLTHENLPAEIIDPKAKDLLKRFRTGFKFNVPVYRVEELKLPLSGDQILEMDWSRDEDSEILRFVKLKDSTTLAIGHVEIGLTPEDALIAFLDVTKLPKGQSRSDSMDRNTDYAVTNVESDLNMVLPE